MKIYYRDKYFLFEDSDFEESENNNENINTDEILVNKEDSIEIGNNIKSIYDKAKNNDKTVLSFVKNILNNNDNNSNNTEGDIINTLNAINAPAEKQKEIEKISINV